MTNCLSFLHETCHFFYCDKNCEFICVTSFVKEEIERESGAKLFLNSKTKEGIVKDGS